MHLVHQQQLKMHMYPAVAFFGVVLKYIDVWNFPILRSSSKLQLLLSYS
jgi:hypothetical protein